jgi:methionyl-tRNA formyltransferase
MKIWRAETADYCGRPGVILKVNQKDGLIVGAGGGAVRILDLQMQGKRRMASDEYICGCRLAEGLALDAD